MPRAWRLCCVDTASRAICHRIGRHNDQDMADPVFKYKAMGHQVSADVSWPYRCYSCIKLHQVKRLVSEWRHRPDRSFVASWRGDPCRPRVCYHRLGTTLLLGPTAWRTATKGSAPAGAAARCPADAKLNRGHSCNVEEVADAKKEGEISTTVTTPNTSHEICSIGKPTH